MELPWYGCPDTVQCEIHGDKESRDKPEPGNIPAFMTRVGARNLLPMIESTTVRVFGPLSTPWPQSPAGGIRRENNNVDQIVLLNGTH